MERDIIARLADEGGSFSKRQRSIAKYICDNCDKAAFMTAEMLSRSAGVSESTVVRFATELGYDGYPGMRRALQSVMRDRLAARFGEQASLSSGPAREGGYRTVILLPRLGCHG